jgi:hypothetical protein
VEATALRSLRASAQLLHRPERLVAPQLVSRLLAVQAQDLRSARLALRARTEGLTAAAVDVALTEERSLVVAWLQRGTLQLVTTEDLGWLLPLTARVDLATTRRRLGQLRISPAVAERAVTIVEKSLAAEGPLTRPELAQSMAAHGIPTEGQATPLLLRLAVREGIAVLGPIRDGVHAFAHAEDWLGAKPATKVTGELRDTALAELARRYLAAHAPATARDLAHHSGLPLGDARKGLGAIASELQEHEPGAGDGLLCLASQATPREPAPAPPRLLPAFDPYLLDWADRSFAVPAENARRVHPGGGMLRATATADGLVVGTWTKSGIEPFEELADEVAAALETERSEVDRFLG